MAETSCSRAKLYFLKAIIPLNSGTHLCLTKFSLILVRQELSNCLFRQSYFSSDQGGETAVMPKHNEDFPQRRVGGKEQV